jgi:hypothetical protein
MLAQRCTCGFERLADEEVIDHLMAVFAPDDATGTDGQVHEELPGSACSCGFSATTSSEMDTHFLAIFTPASHAASEHATA